jgi:hypothetical protein
MSCRKEPNSATFCRKVLNSALIDWSSFVVWLVAVSAAAGPGGPSADPSLGKLAAMDSYAECKACKPQLDLEKSATLRPSPALKLIIPKITTVRQPIDETLFALVVDGAVTSASGVLMLFLRS